MHSTVDHWSREKWVYFVLILLSSSSHLFVHPQVEAEVSTHLYNWNPSAATITTEKEKRQFFPAYKIYIIFQQLLAMRFFVIAVVLQTSFSLYVRGT